MSRQEEKPSVGTGWRDVNLSETEDEGQSPTTQELHSEGEDMEQTFTSLSQRGREDRIRQRSPSLLEYESSDESDLDTKNVTKALVNLSMGPFGKHSKRSRLEEDSNLVMFPTEKTGGQSSDTVLETSALQDKTGNGIEKEEATNALLMTATRELASGSYGIIAKSCNVKEAEIKVNYEAGAGVAVAALAEKLTVRKEMVEINAKAGPSGASGARKADEGSTKSTQLLEHGLQHSTIKISSGMVAHGNVSAHSIHINVAQTLVTPQEKGSTVASFWMVEAPIHTFVGRQELLRKTHEKLQERLREKHFMKRIVAVVAMGGMGKTETVRKLAHHYRNYYPNVAWIDAETERSVKASFLKIANILKLFPADDTEGKDLAELVYRHISEHVTEPSLFIFDNAVRIKTEGDVFGIFDFLPSQVVENLPSILLTSQSTEWRRNQCEIINVTELSSEESLIFLLQTFDLSLTEVENDNSLRDLVLKLADRLSGYPLSLGLAAANISYIPGQGSMELLKQNLKKYIQCVDNNTILGQRVDAELATNYPHTLYEVFDIAVTNLGRREHPRAAKHLLSILAFFPQQNLEMSSIRLIYEARNEKFGISFPDKVDASFEEALHELQTLGLARVEGSFNPKVKVHRLVQTLARLRVATDFEILKLLLTKTVYWCDHVVIPEEYFLTKGKIQDWALESEWKALLWLHGLWFLQRERCTTASGNDLIVDSNQLVKFENGGDIAAVAAFIVNSNQYENNWSSTANWNLNLLFALITDINNVMSSLAGASHEIQVCLEHLLLTVVSEVGNKACKGFVNEAHDGSLSCSDTNVLNYFKSWFSSFDFLTVFHCFPALQKKMGSVVWSLIEVSCVIALVFPKFRLVEPAVIFRLADAKSVLRDEQEKGKISITLVRQRAKIWNPDDAEELVQKHNLLDHMSAEFKCDVAQISVFEALGIMRQLVWKSNCTRQVTKHGDLKENLNACSMRMASCDPPSEHACFKRYRTDEQTMARFPGAVTGALEAYVGTDYIFNMYRAIITSFAIYTSLPLEECIDAERILAELFPLSFCESALCRLAEFDYSEATQQRVTDSDWKALYVYGGPFLSTTELEEDKDILNCTVEKLETKATILHEDGYGNLMQQLVKRVRKLNEYFLYLIMEANEFELIDFESTDSDESTEFEIEITYPGGDVERIEYKANAL